ncbi:hypothetical protein POTOM_006752 [Populus tomentosa]|uniref:Disease resistance protein At4g27190-like leucine-rich repeats domain-containing protein n=1 Tax=Populus tomentosa TaxID=118781 RepID=A0A8X8DG19_POPTO|nr:hypothetical protein POTOM_006752 [Populus tomentosa]
MDASLTELNSLSQLAVLSLRIPKVECIPRDFVFPVSLRKYDIILGNRSDAGRYPSSTRLSLDGTSFNAKTFEQLFLHKLEFVKVSSCGDVFTLFPAKLRQGLKNLKEVIVDSCESLEEVFELGKADEGSSEEKQMPLLSSLTTLQLSWLPELKCPPEILTNLEQMTIDRADNLKQIFYGGEGDALPRDGIIKFPRLRELSLGFRSNYSFFGPTNFDAQLPLQQLTIKGHEEVGNLLAQLQMAAHGQQNGFLQRLESVQVDDCGDVRAPFPALKNLKGVTVDSCKSLEEVFELGLPELKCIWKGPTRNVSLQSLYLLNLSSLNKLAFIFTQSLAQSLPKLERLEINKCGELKHIIREEDGEREIIPESPRFPKLETLLISGCGKLEYVFPVSVSLTLQSLPQLKTLEIRDCHELKHIIRGEDGEREIIQESPRFPKLKTIIIKECGKLEYVFPVSPSLLNLEKMQISDVDNLKQIFYSGEGDALTTDAIIKFPRLSELDLSSRSNYSFFGPKNFAAQLPYLQILKINGHKELGNLSAQLQQNGFLQRLEIVRMKDCGDVRAPFPAKLLQALKNPWRVEIEDCKSLEEVFELGELPDEGRSEEKEMLSSLTELQLQRLPELKCIWKGPTRNVSLQSLYLLNLSSLNKLTFIFTPSLARSLPKLEIFVISYCGELKHIIREEDGEREIFESPGQDDQVEKEIVLPNLKLLSLEQLSSIVCFSFGWCDYFLFPRLEKLKVHQCPKLTTKFATTPDGSMSAQSKVSEVAEDSSINREWTRNNGWKEVKEEEEELLRRR